MELFRSSRLREAEMTNARGLGAGALVSAEVGRPGRDSTHERVTLLEQRHLKAWGGGPDSQPGFVGANCYSIRTPRIETNVI